MGRPCRAGFFPQALCPIVVDLDVKGTRYVDSFLWNLQRSTMTCEEYAAATCYDLQLSSEMGHLLAESIRAQVAHAWTLIAHAAQREADGAPLLPRHVVLVVDVTNNGKRFCDEFRWDTTNGRDEPEVVARQTCADMGLAPPFDVAIAFALRRELLRVALGAVTAENTAAHQRTQPMPGGADPNQWQPRAAHQDRAPPPQPPGGAAPPQNPPPVPQNPQAAQAPPPHHHPHHHPQLAAPGQVPGRPAAGLAPGRPPMPGQNAPPLPPLGHPSDLSGFAIFAHAFQTQHPAVLQDPSGHALMVKAWESLPMPEREACRIALDHQRRGVPPPPPGGP